MIQTKKTFESLEHLMCLMRESSKVYYSRFGDGDFNIMNGLRDKMHDPNYALQYELQQVFKIRDELFLRASMLNYELEPGMRPGLFAPASNNAQIEKWAISFGIREDEVFESHIMFHYLSVFHQDKMIQFLDNFIRPKIKVFVGSVPKAQIEKLVGSIHHYIQVPERNAYSTIDKWYPEVFEACLSSELVIPCAGMAGRVINGRLWKSNVNIHAIDLGSIVDAACNKSTRTWIDLVGQEKIQKLLIK